MGIYDGYDPPRVDMALANVVKLPMHSGATQASYWIGRSCVRLLALGFVASFTVTALHPDSAAIESRIQDGLTIVLPVFLFVQCIGFLLGLWRLVLPSRAKGRAIWGLLLNCVVPIFCTAVVVTRTFLPG